MRERVCVCVCVRARVYACQHVDISRTSIRTRKFLHPSDAADAPVFVHLLYSQARGGRGDRGAGNCDKLHYAWQTNHPATRCLACTHTHAHAHTHTQSCCNQVATCACYFSLSAPSIEYITVYAFSFCCDVCLLLSPCSSSSSPSSCTYCPDKIDMIALALALHTTKKDLLKNIGSPVYVKRDRLKDLYRASMCQKRPC